MLAYFRFCRTLGREERNKYSACMQYWASDYQEGCAPQILQRLMETNLSSHAGYGMDEISSRAKRKIAKACGNPDLDVWFLVGGTQTNVTVLSAALPSWQGALCATSGHINCHEAGAPEYCGVKVLAIPGHDGGKISACQVEEAVRIHDSDESCDHIIGPGLVYISHPTEYGTLYTEEELSRLHAVCEKHHIPLFLDGARLGYGLAVEGAPSLEDIARNVDIFTIGGTKVGALFGEAVVARKGLLPHFFTQIKQHGALLAKGWLLGLQFDTLFTDDLYLHLGQNGIETSKLLRALFKEKGYSFHPETPTNQNFVVLENGKMQKLKEKGVVFSKWEELDATHTVCRFATSWATTKEQVEALARLI